MEKEYQISWVKIIGVTALIVALIAIICLVYPKKDNTVLTQQTYIENISLMKDAGFEYFSGSHLPKEIGDSTRITLDEMIARNLIVDFLDEEGNSCNTGVSYIEATKMLDNEYEMSVYLSCNNKSDYIVTSISNEVVCTNCDVPIDDEKNDTTTKPVDNSQDKDTTIKPTYNNNSSSNNTSQNNNNNTNSNTNTNTSNNDKPITITQTTNVNINYVNTCCTNGDSSNCNDNCLTNVYHSVVFDANGGSSVRTQTVKHGSTAEYKTTYRYGYEFLGWYLDGEKYDFSTPVTEKITLVAKWQKKDTTSDDKPSVTQNYIVRFDTNGGSSVNSQKVVEGNLAVEPKNPTRDCYDFVGWYTDSSLTKKYNFNTPVTSDITLYAKWEENGTCTEAYRVKFDSNGGSSVSTQWIEEGFRASEPKDPTRSGYEFLGWYLDGYKFNFNTRIYEDITLEAKWQREEEQYYEYCKIEDKTYYSVSYIFNSQETWNYSWEVEFYDLKNIQNLEVIDYGYLTTLSMYNKAVNPTGDKGFSTVGDDGDGSVPITSGTMLRTYSLKSSNFVPYVEDPYVRNGKWYTTLEVRIKNYNNLNSYYANNIKSWIHFVPFYFTVQYTDLNNCVTDKASNSYRYDDYEIVDKYWK